VALQAKRPHIREVALPSAFGNRHDVVRIPKRFPAPFAQFPRFQKLASSRIVELAQIAPHGYGVDSALRANAAVALENPLPKITRIGPQFPGVNAGF